MSKWAVVHEDNIFASEFDADTCQLEMFERGREYKVIEIGISLDEIIDLISGSKCKSGRGRYDVCCRCTIQAIREYSLKVKHEATQVPVPSPT